MIHIQGKSWKWIKILTIEQLVSIAFCGGILCCGIPWVATFSKSLRLFPITCLSYGFALFSILICFLSSALDYSRASQLLSVVPSSCASGSFCSSLTQVTPVKLSNLLGLPLFVLMHCSSYWPRHSASLGWKSASTSWSIIHLFLFIWKEKL